MLKENRILRSWLLGSLVVLGLGLFQPSAKAVWQTILYENFGGTIPSWPWGNWTVNYPPPYTWGVQDYIAYPSGQENHSLWCVGEPPNLDPEFNPYPNNTNAWAKWGPINLSLAVAARASFNYLCESWPMADSFRWGANPNNSFAMPYVSGRFSGNTLNQWWGTYVDFDSLPTGGGGYTSLLGDASVWVIFHFQSNAVMEDSLKGAFIDNVTIAWDDGTFDLAAIEAGLAYPDSSIHYDTTAVIGDTLRFFFIWKAEGSGPTPFFDIDCQLDEQDYYTERRNAEIGSQMTIWDTTYSSLWVVTPDTHIVEWTIDADNEIAEDNERNNQATRLIPTRLPNVPPWIYLTHPTYGDTAAAQFLITWEDYDPDNNADIYLFWNTDTVGTNWYPIALIFEDDSNSYLWNITSSVPQTAIWIIAQIADAETTFTDFSDGPLIVNHNWSIAPNITVLEPSGDDTAGQQFFIRWEDEDPDNNALISLFWDTDSLGNVGTQIPGAVNLQENSLADSFLWNILTLPEGNFWVLAKITDPGHTVYDYSDGPLVVSHSGSYNIAPTITVTNPTPGDTAAAQFLITWTDGDPDDSSLISLYYDDDSVGVTGEPIPGAGALPENSATNSFQWDVSSVPEGSYWVLAAIADDDTVVFDHSPGPLVIDYGYGVNDPPVIQILRPTTGDSANTSFTITWTDEDPDNNATIALYRDTDNAGYNGTLIAGNLQEDDEADSFLWNVATLAEGDYWVYAAITDPDTTTYDYSEAPLRIYHPSGVTPWGKIGTPQDFALETIYPNPFNNSTTFRVAIPRQTEVALQVYDFTGRLQNTPYQGPIAAGYHEIAWTPTELPSGIYLVQLTAPGVQVRAKLVLLK